MTNQNTHGKADITALNKRIQSLEDADRHLMLEEIDLTVDEEKFAHAVASHGSKTKAVLQAKLVNPRTPRHKIHKVASKLWSNPLVRKRVRQIMLPILMDFDITAYQVVDELRKIAMADITDFVGVKKVKNPVTGKFCDKVYLRQGQLKALRRTGETSVIKELSQRADGTIVIKLHDKSSAQSKLAELLFNTWASIEQKSAVAEELSFADLLKLDQTDPRRKDFFQYLQIESEDVNFEELSNEDAQVKNPNSKLLKDG